MTIDTTPIHGNSTRAASIEPLEAAIQGPSRNSSRIFGASRGRLRWFGRLGRGIILDIRSRAPWYVSDWTDAWNYRVVPATALIFFAK